MENLENKAAEAATDNKDVKVEENKVVSQPDQKTEEKLFTQADVDLLIEKRLAREKKKAEAEKAKAEEATKAKDDSEEIKALKEMIRAKDQRIIRQEAAKVADTMGVDKDFIDAVIALADFSEITLDNNGGVDVDELKDTLKGIIDKYPKFLAAKKVEEASKGFIKAGAEQKQEAPVNKIEEQIRRAMGL